MNLTDFNFLVFLLIVLVLYYSLGRLQKYTLLLASSFFYLQVSGMEWRNLALMMAYILSLTYMGGRLIGCLDGWKRKLVLLLSVSGLAGILVVTKYAFNMLTLAGKLLHSPADFSVLEFGGIAGISYFILSAIGYLADVYMEIVPADQNVGTVALFIFYFPQIISGPVSRFPEMSVQFRRRHSLCYPAVVNGMRRMIWGYLKKLVISERFAVIAGSVFRDYTSYSGIGILCATFCYGIQIYTDFSGCMDIVLGVSEMFGITLPENFRSPYMSVSYQEFYQRWHMTLGGWFKDYVMYPLQKSAVFQKIGKAGRKALGKKAGKKLSFYLAMLVLWFLIGVWHGGTALYFMVSTILPFSLLVGSDLLQPIFKKINILLCIDTSRESWRCFQRGRTFLTVCPVFLFLCAGGISRGFQIIGQMLRRPVAYTPFEEAFAVFGLDSKDAVIMTLGVAVLLFADIQEDKGRSLRDVMDRQNLLIRQLVIGLELVCIAMYGMVGVSEFIYFQF